MDVLVVIHGFRLLFYFLEFLRLVYGYGLFEFFGTSAGNPGPQRPSTKPLPPHYESQPPPNLALWVIKEKHKRCINLQCAFSPIWFRRGINTAQRVPGVRFVFNYSQKKTYTNSLCTYCTINVVFIVHFYIYSSFSGSGLSLNASYRAAISSLVSCVTMLASAWALISFCVNIRPASSKLLARDCRPNGSPCRSFTVIRCVASLIFLRTSECLKLAPSSPRLYSPRSQVYIVSLAIPVNVLKSSINGYIL